MTEIINARIAKTSLGTDRPLSFWIHLDYGGSGQGAGGYNLGDHNKPWKGGIAFISKILDVVGVENWEDLVGKYVRVDREFSKVHGIGNILKDNWLYFQKFAKEQLEGENESI